MRSMVEGAATRTVLAIAPAIPVQNRFIIMSISGRFRGSIRKSRYESMHSFHVKRPERSFRNHPTMRRQVHSGS